MLLSESTIEQRMPCHEMELIFRLLRPRLSGEREVTYSDQMVVVKMKVIYLVLSYIFNEQK